MNKEHYWNFSTFQHELNVVHTLFGLYSFWIWEVPHKRNPHEWNQPLLGIYLNYTDSFTHAQAKDLVYSKIEMSWAKIEALVLAEVLILIPFYCQFHDCQAYRVSHSKEGKVFLLWRGYRFWFLLVFWVVCVNEIGTFISSLSVFICLKMRTIYGSICNNLLLLSEFWVIGSF